MGNVKSRHESPYNIIGCLDFKDFYQKNDFDSLYEITKNLGGGQFSNVYLCHAKSDRTKRFALKIMVVNRNDITTYNRIISEIKIMKLLNETMHPYILKLYNTYQSVTTTPDDNVNHCFKLVFELCEGGDLFHYINRFGAFSEDEGRVLIAKLASALVYIHSKGIIHRDLKPENILLKSEGKELDVRLSDFGLARLRDTSFRRSSSLCGSDFYLPPEMILQKEYSFEVDIWSFGVLCFVILCGHPPFYHTNITNLYQQIIEADFQTSFHGKKKWDSLSDGAKNFIHNLLQTDPNKRPTALMCIKHRWLRIDSKIANELRLLSCIHEDKLGKHKGKISPTDGQDSEDKYSCGSDYDSVLSGNNMNQSAIDYVPENLVEIN